MQRHHQCFFWGKWHLGNRSAKREGFTEPCSQARHSCSNGNVTSLWCHCEAEVLPCLPQPPHVVTSIPPAFLHVCRWDVVYLHGPGSAKADPCQGQHLRMLCQQRQAMGQTHSVEVSPMYRQPKASGKMPLGKCSPSLLHGESGTINPPLLLGL